MGFSKTLVLCLAILVLLSICEAKELVVGGSKSSWKIPSSPDEYNKWAQTKRFRIGDSIVFKYDGKNDSVLQVSEEKYKYCNKSNPIQTYTDGNSRITLDKSGPFYFISGADGNCEQGQKVEIRVLSVKHPGGSSLAPAPSSDDERDQHYAPAPAPKKNGGGDSPKGVLAAAVATASIIIVNFII